MDQQKVNSNLNQLLGITDSENDIIDRECNQAVDNPNFLTEEDVFDILYPDSGFENETYYSEE